MLATSQHLSELDSSIVSLASSTATEHHEETQHERDVQYREELHQQMNDNIDAKKLAKDKQFDREVKLVQADHDSMVHQDYIHDEEKMNKMSEMRHEMEDEMSIRAETELYKKEKDQAQGKRMESYWVKDRQDEEDDEQVKDRETKNILEMENQDDCAALLCEVNKKSQSRSHLQESMSAMSNRNRDQAAEEKLATRGATTHHELPGHYDSSATQTHSTTEEVLDLEKRFRQSQLSSELDGQIADKARVKREEKKTNDGFHETWMWGNVDRNQDRLIKQRQDAKDIAEYNRNTVIAHEQGKKQLKIDRAAEEARNSAIQEADYVRNESANTELQRKYWNNGNEEEAEVEDGADA